MLSKENIKNKILELSQIGADEAGGISRVFGSDYMKEATIRVETYFKECGMETYVDTVGNVHGILKCGNPDAKELFMGSHLDTVKQGGMFDGLLGVVAAAEIVRAFVEEKITLNKNIHVIASNGEEGNELGGTFGSRTMCGMLDLSSSEFLKKAEKYGYNEEILKKARLDTKNADCYMELHIEQGPTLYNRKEKIGIVTGIVGLRRYEIVVNGVSNHAGTTMMEDRDDALVRASKIVLYTDQLARKIGNRLVATIGVMNVYPGIAPTIPNKCEMILEVRAESENLLDTFITKFKEDICTDEKIKIKEFVRKKPVKCNEELLHSFEEICEKMNLAYEIMPSGATHDGNAMATLMPIEMIFIPSKNGISHSKDEFSEWDDVTDGAQVLYEGVKLRCTEKGCEYGKRKYSDV